MSLPLEDLLKGKYEILDKIAEGGIGSIYKVRHQLLGQIRAIKVLRAQVAEREDLRHRLMREAQTAIRLRHPNIAQLHDLAVAEDGTAYIVMEFIDGVTLDALIDVSGAPSVDLSLEIAKQALSAVGCLHEAGFIHRDISPDNLMLTRDFEQRVRIKLIDLGIAKDLAEESGVTAAGTFLGKVKYCPPELFQDTDGAARLDERSDNYSLGITLYQLLTGDHPFTGETFEELAAAHLFRAPRPFDETDPDGKVPEELRLIILSALEKDPDKRPATASEFRARLDRFEIDDAKIDAELEGILGDASRFLNKFEKYGASGSTQAHLDEQFGVEATSVVEAREEADETEAVAAEKADTILVGESGDEQESTGVPAWAKTAAALVVVALAAFVIRGALRSRTPEVSPAPARQIAEPIATTQRFDPAAASAGLDAVLLPPDAPAKERTSAAIEEEVDQASPAAELAATTEPQETPPSQTEPTATSTPETSDSAPAVDRPIELLKEGPGVIPPKLLEPLEPSYPKPDKREIVITVSVLVSETGKALTASVKSAPTFKRRFKEAALAAVDDADFEPATKDGVAGKMWTDVEVRFLP